MQSVVALPTFLRIATLVVGGGRGMKYTALWWVKGLLQGEVGYAVEGEGIVRDAHWHDQ